MIAFTGRPFRSIEGITQRTWIIRVLHLDVDSFGWILRKHNVASLD